MSVKERIKEYINYKDISIRKFCLNIGVTAGYVYNISKSIPPEKIDRISKCYPDLNITWLMTGEGEMIKEESTLNYISANDMVEVPTEAWLIIKQQAESLASKDRQVEELINLLKKANAPKEGNAICADASGSDLEK